MESGNFRRLVRRGIFPPPKRTQSGLPFFDHELLLVIAEVVKRRVGVNGQEIMMYRRKSKTPESGYIHETNKINNNPFSHWAKSDAILFCHNL
jgi:hypothetical protein